MPDPKKEIEVQLVCACCGFRSEVDPRYANHWPEHCGQKMDRHEDACPQQNKDFNDWSNLVM